eukprot:9836-Heterococcus_DN1.PRE.1
MPPLGGTVLSVGSTTVDVTAGGSVGSVTTAVKLLTMPRQTASADDSPTLSSLLRPYSSCLHGQHSQQFLRSKVCNNSSM